MIVRLVNLTPHELVIGADADSAVRVPVSGPAARVREVRDGTVDLPTRSGLVPVTEVSYADELVDLPTQEPGVRFVVSRIAAAASITRDDLLFPLDEIRDSEGRIVACAGLGRFSLRSEAEGVGEPPLEGRESARS